MKDDLLKLFAVAPASNEYNDVEKELTKTGLNLNIISVCSVINTQTRLSDVHRSILYFYIIENKRRVN